MMHYCTVLPHTAASTVWCASSRVLLKEEKTTIVERKGISSCLILLNRLHSCSPKHHYLFHSRWRFERFHVIYNLLPTLHGSQQALNVRQGKFCSGCFAVVNPKCNDDIPFVHL